MILGKLKTTKCDRTNARIVVGVLAVCNSLSSQAAASAADFSSPRFLDDKMLKRLADAIAALDKRDSNSACLWA